MSPLVDLLVLAIGAAFYPTLLAVVVILLGRPQPARLLLFFLLGALSISVTIGLAAVFVLQPENFGGHEHSVGAWVNLVAGMLALVGAALLLRAHRRARMRGPAPESTPSRSQRALSHGSGWIAFAAGIFLDLPSIFYLVGLKDIALGDYSALESVLLVLGFNLIMFALIEVPLVAYAVWPESTQARVQRLNDWLSRNGRLLGAAIAATIGVFLLVRGLAVLL